MTPTPKVTRWWVARGNTSGHYYLGEAGKYGTPSSHGEFLGRVGTHKMVHHLWDILSSFRLKPGEGPVQVTLEVKVRKVR